MDKFKFITTNNVDLVSFTYSTDISLLLEIIEKLIKTINKKLQLIYI